MPRTGRLLVVLLLAALLPLRAVAAVTIGFCAAGHQDQAVQAHAGHAHHDGDEQPADSSKPSCSNCAAHCSGAAFAPSAVAAVEAARITEIRISLAERVAPAFISDQLDRPPLARLR